MDQENNINNTEDQVNTPVSMPVESAQAELVYDADFELKISRLFIFRFLWLFIEIWVLMVWAIWIGILNFVHFWYMLILGARSENIWKRQFRFMRHLAKWNAYLKLIVNKRPMLIED